MATKPRGTAILEHRAHVNHKKEEIAAYLNNVREGFKHPEETRHIIEALEKKFDKDTKFLTEQEVDILAAKLIRETELELIEAAKKTEKDDKIEDSSSHGSHAKRKIMGEIKEVSPENKGKVVTQTVENTAVPNPKSTITRGGFGKTAATAAAGQTITPAGSSTRDRLDQRVRTLVNEAKADQKISRGHSLVRRFIPGNLFASIARTRRLRKIKKELKAGYTGQVKRDAQKEVIEMNKTLKSTLKSFREGIKANQEIEKKAAAEGRKEVEAIITAQKEIAASVVAAQGAARLKDIRREVDIASPEEIEGYMMEDSYLNEGSDRPALGNPRADSPMVSRDTSSGDDYDNDAEPIEAGGDDSDGGGQSGNRRQRKRRRLPSKLGTKAGNGAEKAGIKAAQIAIQIAARLFAMGPVGWGILIGGFILLLLLLLLFIFFGGDEEAQNRAQQEASQQTETLTIRKEKINPPDLNATNGQTVTFNIVVTDTKSAQEITIIDHIPDGVSLVEADITSTWMTNRVFDANAKTLTWKASENLPAGALNAPNFTITVTYRVTGNNIHLITWAEANPIRGGTFGGQNIPPSNDDCHGIYRSYMTMLARVGKANYGDPNCELVKQDPNGKWFIDKDMLFSYMWESTDGPRLSRNEAEGVFLCIMPKECGGTYNVNAFNPNSTSTSQGTPGAFGCFQMNAQGFSNPNQPEDVGDVVWQLQITNANNWRNNNNGGRWRDYWPESYSGCLRKYGL